MSATTSTTKVIKQIVLTGGPGGGKTAAMSYLTEQLTSRGWRVLLVPEAATLIIAGGVGDIASLAVNNREAYLGVQVELMGVQLDLADRYGSIAAALPDQKVVLLHDRGALDDATYLTGAEFAQVAAAHGLSAKGLEDRYDAVVHLRTAAFATGYTTANNAARRESPERARELDEATLSAWMGHSHLAVIGAAPSLGEKLDRVLAAVLGVLGDPDPIEAERKFVLAGAPDLSHPMLAGARVVHIEQFYLPDSDGGEQRVRSRTQAGVSVFTHCVKKELGGARRIEVETPIDEQAYRLLSALADPATAPVRKVRRIFVVGATRFELDEILEPRQAWLCEVELVEEDDDVVLPDFLGPVVEVTNDRAWRNRELARVA